MDNVNPVARRIASLVREAIAVTVPFGRGQTGLDKARHDGALAGLGRNPNFGAALVVSLEPHSARALAEAIAVSGKPVEWLAVQPLRRNAESHGTGRAPRRPAYGQGQRADA